MPPTSARSERSATSVKWIGLAAVVAIAAGVSAHRGIVRNFFFADDFLSLYDLANLPLADFLLRTHAGHGLLVRNLVFWVTAEAFGPDSAAFYGTALAGHALAVGLLFASALRATGNPAVACLGAVLWGTCPTSAGTLGWYAVFGQVLATILVLAGLWLLLGAETDPRGMTARRIGMCGVLLVTSASCFGVGLPVIAVSPLVIWLLAPPPGLSRRAWLATALIPLATAAIYLLEQLVAPAPVTPPGDGPPPFTLGDGPYAVRATSDLIGFGIAALVRGPWSARIPWPTTGSLVAVAAGGAVLVAGLAAGTRSMRRLLVALALVAAGTYAAIALARTPLYAFLQWPPAQVAATPRYHYFAQAMLALTMSVGLHAVAVRVPARLGHAAIVAALAVVLWADSRRLHAVDHHDRDRVAMQMLLDRVHRTALDAPPGSTVRIPNRAFPQASPFIAFRPETFPGSAALFMIFTPTNEIEGRTVVFEAQNPRVLEARKAGGRITTLLVPPAGGYTVLPFSRPKPAPPAQ
jgi:hypothetical protein